MLPHLKVSWSVSPTLDVSICVVFVLGPGCVHTILGKAVIGMCEMGICSLARIAQSFTCSARLALLVHSNALPSLLACLLTPKVPSARRSMIFGVPISLSGSPELNRVLRSIFACVSVNAKSWRSLNQSVHFLTHLLCFFDSSLLPTLPIAASALCL